MENLVSHICLNIVSYCLNIFMHFFSLNNSLQMAQSMIFITSAIFSKPTPQTLMWPYFYPLFWAYVFIIEKVRPKNGLKNAWLSDNSCSDYVKYIKNF